ncbi:MAG: translation initiation factor IF-2 subunit alpha [Candidatus Bathyarchaeota archaeon]|nr:translation initiation factor IF-2 subunit alpha [Candidatus Bathyarchaeota archaeon]
MRYMPTFKAEEWPEVGELIIATVKEITDYGAYVTLDEYGREGFLHISEISSGWIRNIRDHVREGEKVVLKVLRVDPSRNQIDLSLRRVTQREKREKILLWKRSRKAESLLRSAAQKLNMSLEKLYDVISDPFRRNFSDIYDGLEAAAREGEGVLVKAGLPKGVAEVLAAIAREKIKVTTVKVRGTLNLTCIKPDGVLRIKEAMLKAKEAGSTSKSSVNIYVIAPPKYQVEVIAKDYKEANVILKKVADTAISVITSLGGEGSFTPEGG